MENNIEVIGKSPVRAHSIDAGADLSSASLDSIVLQPGERKLIPTGTALNLPPGLVGYVCARSGLAHNWGVTILNSPGVVDSGYTDQIYVNLINLGEHPFAVNHGDRIAQLVVQPVNLSNYTPVTEFVVRFGERGNSGHGSTGVT